MSALITSACLSACTGIHVRGGTGTFEYTTDGSNFAGETDTSYYGVELLRSDDAPKDIGFRYERWSVDDDLFSGIGISNVETDLSIASLTSKHSWYEGEQLEVPATFGLSYLDLRLEDSSTRLTWEALGIDFGLAPYVPLVRGPKGELGLFGEIGYTIGQAGADLAGDSSIASDGFTTILSYGVGVRYRRGAIAVSGGLQARRINIDAIDLSSGSESREVDHSVSTNFFSFEASF